MVTISVCLWYVYIYSILMFFVSNIQHFSIFFTLTTTVAVVKSRRLSRNSVLHVKKAETKGIRLDEYRLTLAGAEQDARDMAVARQNVLQVS